MNKKNPSISYSNPPLLNKQFSEKDRKESLNSDIERKDSINTQKLHSNSAFQKTTKQTFFDKQGSQQLGFEDSSLLTPKHQYRTLEKSPSYFQQRDKNQQLTNQAKELLQKIEQTNLQYHLLKGQLDQLIYLPLTYNMKTIVYNDKENEDQQNNEIVEFALRFIQQNKPSPIQNRTYNMMLSANILSQTVINNKKLKIIKPYKKLLTQLIFENKQASLLIVNYNQTQENQLSNSNNNNMILSIKSQENQLSSSPSKKFTKCHFNAVPKLFALNYDFLTYPCPHIAIDHISGRHFVYNNNDKILIFSHNPLYQRFNDKSKPLIEISLDDQLEEEKGKPRSARIDPTLYIIYDNKGNAALLVIGGYNLDKNNEKIPRNDVKVFKIKRREIDVKPAFRILLNYPRMNPIVIKVKQSQCMEELNTKGTENDNPDKQYLILLGGIDIQEISNKEEKLKYYDTNTTCSLIEYQTIFDQLLRKETEDLKEYKTLNIRYGDKQNKKKYLDKIVNNLNKGVFIKQKKQTGQLNNRMLLICDKKQELLEFQSIPIAEHQICLLQSVIEVQSDKIKWCYTNAVSDGNYLLYLNYSNNNFSNCLNAIKISENTKVPISMQNVLEFNTTRKNEFVDILKKNKSADKACNIF